MHTGTQKSPDYSLLVPKQNPVDTVLKLAMSLMMRGISLTQAAYKALLPLTALPATILSFTGKGLSAPSFLFLAYPWVSSLHEAWS